MEFVLIFITGPCPAKLGRTAQQQLLTLASLDSEIPFWFLVTLHALLTSCTCMWYMNDNHLGVDFFFQEISYLKSYSKEDEQLKWVMGEGAKSITN